MPCRDFEVPHGGIFSIAMQTHTQPGPKGTLLSREPTTGTTKHVGRRIGITKKRKSAASSRKQREKIPSQINMGERAARHRNFTGKAIINWNKFDLVAAFVHGLPRQEKAHTRCHWQFADGNMGPNARNGIPSLHQRPTEVIKR